MIGQDFALFKQWSHQTIGNPPVIGAFAHCIDAWIGHGLHGVVHDDAAFAMQSTSLRQSSVGSDAHSHHHQVRLNALSVLEHHLAHTT